MLSLYSRSVFFLAFCWYRAKIDEKQQFFWVKEGSDLFSFFLNWCFPYTKTLPLSTVLLWFSVCLGHIYFPKRTFQISNNELQDKILLKRNSLVILSTATCWESKDHQCSSQYLLLMMISFTIMLSGYRIHFIINEEALICSQLQIFFEVLNDKKVFHILSK